MGWESIGNSNWFMFDTFVLYLLFVLTFTVLKKSEWLRLVVFSILCIILVGLLIHFKDGDWWFNTLLCFPLGMWYAKFKKGIDSFVCKSMRNYILTLTMLILAFVGFFVLNRWNTIFYIAYSMIFALLDGSV